VVEPRGGGYSAGREARISQTFLPYFVREDISHNGLGDNHNSELPAEDDACQGWLGQVGYGIESSVTFARLEKAKPVTFVLRDPSWE
jgi:hypothetical protein